MDKFTLATRTLVSFSSLLVLVNCQYNNGPGKFPGSSTEELPTLHIDEKTVTVSGFSSGGSFAQMMQIAHSSRIHGVASFSHTYYRCGRPTGKVDDYDKACTKLFNPTASDLYDVDKVHEDIRNYYSKKLIDNPENLKSKRLYVYTGLRNFLFTPAQSLSIMRVFEKYIPNPKQIMNRVQDSQLVLPTDNSYGRPCTESAEDRAFIGNCGFSGPQEAINFLLLNDLRYIRDGSVKKDPKLASRLKTFDQTPFTKDISKHNMDTKGYYFIPSNCGNQRCNLHFYFHGCLNGREFNGTTHVLNSGYLEIGEQNDIIMIFPQAKGSLPENEIGCWDTFGISGPNYATKQGAQIVAVTKMMDKLIRKNSGGSPGWGGGGGGHHKHNRQGGRGRNGRNDAQNEWSF